MKKITIATLLYLLPLIAFGQSYTPDTVEVELGRTSKIVFTMQDSNDLYQLKHYDFQALFDDILTKLENKEAAMTTTPEEDDREPKEEADEKYTERPSYKDFDDKDNDDDDDWNSHDFWNPHYPSSRQFLNIDFGINDYAEDPNSPDVGQPYYTVHPWGSWAIALNAVNRTRFSDKFSLEAGLGLSWYNFKFEADNTHLDQLPSGVLFVPDSRNLFFKKSKLTVSYVNVTLVPVFSTGHQGDNVHHWWRRNQSEFRFGLGPYIGYRLGSHTKQVYEFEGNKQVEKNHDDFYLQDLRYGLRLQIGMHGADFFVNYDLNSLFSKGDGAELHPYSFGFTF